MKTVSLHNKLVLSMVFALWGLFVANAQFLLQAPNEDGEVRTNFRWYEASDRVTVLGTDSFYEASDRGVYFATYDGTSCGRNATGYFILTNCNAPDNEVTLDISANVVPPGATLSWSPAVAGDQNSPTVIATKTVMRYTATITKAGNRKSLPNFNVVCMAESATLVDDVVSINEDEPFIIDIYENDSDLPVSGSLTISETPDNGILKIEDNGTPDDPSDDAVTYIPNADFNGTDRFDYTVCTASGACSTAIVTVEILPVLDTVNNFVATTQNLQIEVAVLDNDNDLPSEGTLTLTNPFEGTANIDDNGTPNDPSDDTVIYVPNPDFIGTDTFTYTLCDSIGNCSTATVSVMVNEIGVSLDSDGDGILDSFEDLDLDGDNDPATDPTDTDNDTYADYLDIDSDNDGIPDNVEAQTTLLYQAPSGSDANGNGLDDVYEENGTLGIIPEDTDGDGIPDYVDNDSDNDNIPDSIEGHDYDHDGVADIISVGSDKDGDGLDDGYEGSRTIDNDGNDEIDDPYNTLPNTDGDDEVDYRDTDDDGDGIASRNEDTNNDGIYINDDSNGNGTPDYLEANAIDDIVKIFNIITPNGDGIHDVLSIEGLEKYPDNSIRIYNRWGVKIYGTTDYNTRGNVFTGKSEGRVTLAADRNLPVGTYFYIIDYTDNLDQKKKLSGYLYINR